MRLSSVLVCLSLLAVTAAQAHENCDHPTSTVQFKQLNELTASLPSKGMITNQCVQLKVGESAPVANAVSPTTVEQAYKLTRLSKKRYRSEIRLELVPDKDSGVTTEDIDKMKAFQTKCLKNFGSEIKGPNGEILEIVTSEDPSVPSTQIKVRKGAFRQDSRLYSTSMNCPTLLHEILHLHGLVDEYKEQSIGFTVDPKTGVFKYIEKAEKDIAFDCRHLGPESSIMRNHWAALVESKDWQQWDYKVCVGKNLDAKPTSSCPAGTTVDSRVTNLTPDQGFDSPALEDGTEQFLIGSEKKAKLVPRSKQSLLEPAHFNAIVHPGCTVNKTYYACSFGAYMTSTQPVSLGSAPASPSNPYGGMTGRNACPPSPPECQQQNWVQK